MKRLLPILLLVFSVGVGAYDEDDLQKLKSTNECFKCDLSRANLVDANLRGANLGAANLFKANLTKANLQSANLTKADLTDANLTEANLTRAYLTEAYLSWANLYGANLSGANLTRAYLTEANLTEANLKDAKGFNTDVMTGAVFCKTIMPDGSENNSACQSTTTESATVATESPSSADFQKGLAAYKSEDYATALREFRPLAEQGHADAQFYLGWMYYRGQGVPKDYKTAVKWYTLAAEQGHANAQNNLGVMYYKGRGVPQDEPKAAVWYTFAAEQGYADAQFNLGLMYANIEAYKTAVKWYTLAAEQGDANAQFNLGVMYARGTWDFPQDNVYAHMWIQIAEASGYKGLDLTGTVNKTALFKWSLAKDMTPTQIKKAQELAREWLLRNTKGVE